MKSIQRIAVFVLCFTPLFLAPTLLSAQSPFDGTWITNDDQSKPSPKPLVASLKGGMYECSTCVPKVSVKADGQDQPVSGQSYDTLNVHEINDKSVEFKTRKNGKPVYEMTRTVSDDGKTMTVKTVEHSPDGDKTATYEATAERIGKAPAGANAISGSWRLTKTSANENGRTTTFKSNGDELTMSNPTGETYTAKFDGKDYPAKGSFFYTSVSLKRINDHTIEETDKRDGKVTAVAKMTVSADGKTMTTVETNKLTGRTSTSVAEKK